MSNFTVTDFMAPLGPEGPGPSPEWLQRCAALLDVDGAAVSLGRGLTELVCFSDEKSARLDDLQFTLGEGPGVDSAENGALYLVGDLQQDPGMRWPVFASEASAQGVRAVFAFPLRLGTIRLGTLVGHRGTAGPIRKEAVSYGFTISDALALFVLAYEAPANEGGRTQRYSPFGDLRRAVVHQATGMVSEQLGLPLPNALVRIRAYAFAHGQPIMLVARGIVDGRVRLPS
ncbi:ANTAR domain-containing protein [Streptomyces sp. BA2]|uniref:ANTAR domain-containing protein n=1 Tax=Streptomyces sp. BA2 TaxID=436595 RepID=UPI001329BB20|nr:ANTAR domain-containing protein [Streptomyces sp. BA2]MWA07891.1 hypothetical protein [Streptomyces sp. BA2]